MELIEKTGFGYPYKEFGNGITSYILFKESYDALLDVEKMGIPVRDVNDEFKGQSSEMIRPGSCSPMIMTADIVSG